MKKKKREPILRENVMNSSKVKSKEISISNTANEPKIKLSRIDGAGVLPELQRYKDNIEKVNMELEKINLNINNMLRERDELIEAEKSKLKELSTLLNQVNNDNILLQNKLEERSLERDKYKKRYEAVQRKYNSLSRSKLGKVTLEIWEIRKKLRKDK